MELEKLLVVGMLYYIRDPVDWIVGILEVEGTQYNSDIACDPEMGSIRSVTRLGYFLKFLVTKFQAKVAKIIGYFLEFFEKSHSYVKTAFATFKASFGYIWATFYSNI